MISGEMRSVKVRRGRRHLCLPWTLASAISSSCLSSLPRPFLFLSLSCCLAFEDVLCSLMLHFCFSAKDVRVLLFFLEMREDVGASPDNDLMTYPCFFSSLVLRHKSTTDGALDGLRS